MEVLWGSLETLNDIIAHVIHVGVSIRPNHETKVFIIKPYLWSRVAKLVIF